MKRLEDVHSKEDAPFFSLSGRQCAAKVFHVYDCDTVHAAIHLFNQATSFRCRLRGIDGPELRSKNVLEKTLAYAGKARVQELVEQEVVQIRCHHFDKYGRLLIDVLLPGAIDLGQLLIREALALPYDGGTKCTDWTCLHDRRQHVVHK